ncbi:MAG: DUF4178 domain-containing protein [Acidimicrobiia bacterium]
MEGLLVLLLVVAVAIGVVLYRRSTGGGTPARSPREPQDPLRSERGRSDPRRITVGDVIMFEGRDFIVRGTLAFDEDGFVWHEHLLDDVAIRRWLSVEEDDDGFEAVLWESLGSADVTPGERTVTVEGRTYTLDEHGRARFTAKGTTGTAPSGQVEYYDYQAGDERLSFERYGEGSWEAGRGRVVDEALLDVYPGSD